MKNLKSRAALGRPEYIEVEKNVRLHITDLGEGEPVILIHGWPLNDAMYEYQYEALTKAGFRVIGITMRGFGQSDKPYGKYNQDVFADDLKVVMEELEIEDAVLGGFSFGAATAIRFVSKYNGAHIIKLVLFGAAAPSAVTRQDFPLGLPVEILNSWIALNAVNRPRLIEEFGKLFAATETALSAGFAGWLAGMGFQASGYTMEQGIIMIRDTDLRADLDKIDIPTAIFHGKLDKLCSFDLAKELHARIAGSRLIAFENSGHAIFLEERQKFNDELIHFIRDKSHTKHSNSSLSQEVTL